MNKLLTKIVGAALGATMAVGVGVGVAVNNNRGVVDSQVEAAETGSITFDFEDSGAHRSDTNNNYSSNSYTENGATINLSYADSVTTGTPLNGSANIMARVAKNTTNSPSMKIGAINMSGKKITGISYYAKGPAAFVWKGEYSLNNSTWTQFETHTNKTASQQFSSGALSITGNSTFYIRIGCSVSASTGSHRDGQIDDVVISWETIEPVVEEVTLSPDSDVELKVGEEQEFEVGITGSNLTGNETVSISYEPVYGTASDISIDTASGLKNGDTFTVTAVNGGAAGEITATYGTGGSAVSSEPVAIFTEEQKTLKSLAITNGGTAKTSYIVGETFNPAGLTVTATFEDNSQEDVTSKVTWSPIIIAANTEAVVASYTEVVEKTASFAISVEADYITNVVFNTSNAKTKYSLGDSFVASETGVTAVTKYVVAADGSLTAGQLTYSGYNMNTEGNQTITVSYPNPKSATPFSTTYSISVTKVVVSSVEDSITIADTGVSGTSYDDMTPFSKSSPAVYNGSCAGGDSTHPNTIQIRSKNSDSGLIITTSGGYVKKLTMSLTSSNGVDVYAKTSAYETAEDLFDSTLCGTEIATSVTPDGNGTAVVEFTASTYTYFGIRSHSGASYISSLKVLWENSEAASADVTEINNFIRDYMHLDYTKSEGFCNDASNHWYSTASSEFAKLSTNAKLILATSNTIYKTVTLDPDHKNNDDPETITYRYSDVKARFIAWAEIAGDVITFDTETGAINVQSANPALNNFSTNNNIVIATAVIISILSMTTLCGYFLLRKRKEEK